ncbi:MAG: hypothetical protein EAZ42_08165 [Verrucomicrobia bacterium]|nr:MAG: hypothetical protein EAZ42_08165 [Verrucomicrobiota bacterium]
MQLNLSQKEIATLLEMISLASNVASWNQQPSAVPRLMEYEVLESKIMEKASKQGFAHMIEYDGQSQRFFLSREFEETLFSSECYEEFRNECFWEELTVRMADRDLIRAIGMDAWEMLSEEQRRERCAAWEKRYWQEFSQHGLDRVLVMSPPEEG